MFMASESPGVEREAIDGGNQVPVVADSRASGNYFDDPPIPDLKHPLLDRLDLTVPVNFSIYHNYLV